MKKIKLSIIILLIIVFILTVIVFVKNSEKQKNILLETYGKEEKILIIKNKENFRENAEIKNLKLLHDFIIKSNSRINEKISLKIREYKTEELYEEVIITYIPGTEFDKIENKNSEKSIKCMVGEEEKYYGYYTLYKNNIEKKFDALKYTVKMKTTNNTVDIILKNFFEVTEFEKICSIDLNLTGYNKLFNLNYHQRKDIGIYELTNKEIDNSEFNIYTFGGDVTIEKNNKIYELKEALKQKIITPEDIITQAKLDVEYGICEDGAYSDGGSIEYMYPEYTILKFNTLNGRKDIVIGFKGQIINQFNKEELKK